MLATLDPAIGAQLDVALRLIVSAILGGLIGLERELHEHPAGLRTHLLVSLGSAVFTVMSIEGFPAAPGPGGNVPTDPSRVAAQIVSGIGFLGAGAILKYGTTIKGLTTAASLWATAAVGMAAGAGAWVIASVATAIVLISLWPLHAALTRTRLAGGKFLRLRLGLADLDTLGTVMAELSNRRIEVSDLRSTRRERGYELALDLRLPAGTIPTEVASHFASVPGVEVLDASRNED